MRTDRRLNSQPEAQKRFLETVHLDVVRVADLLLEQERLEGLALVALKVIHP